MKKTIIFTILMIMILSSVHATVLSVTPKEYIRYQNDLRGPAFLVQMRGITDDDFLYGGVDPEELTGENPQGIPLEAENGFTLSIDSTSKSCQYPLEANPSRQDIYAPRYEVLEVGVKDLQDTIDTCKDNGAAHVSFWCKSYVPFSNACLYDPFLNTASFNVMCVYEDLLAKAGDVEGASMDFESVFTLTRDDGEVISEKIGSSLKSEDDVDPVIQLGDEAIVKWVGGVTFGEFCPITTKYIALEHAATNSWSLGDANLYEDYREADSAADEYYDFLKSLVNDNSKRIEDEHIIRYKDLLKRAKDSAEDATATRSISKDGLTTHIDGSVAVLPLKKEYLGYAPDFLTYVSADWLKVILKVSKPEVTHVGFTNCKEGESNNQIEATITNRGESSASFYVRLACEDGVNPTSTVKTTNSIPGGESETITFPFNVALQSDKSVSCEVVAINSNYPEYSDSKSADSQCTASNLCGILNPGQKTCIGETAYICQSNGQLEEDQNDKTCAPEICCNQIDDNDNGQVDENCAGQCVCDYDNRCEGLKGESPQNCNDCIACNTNNVCEAVLGEKWIEGNPKSCADCEPKPDYTIYMIIGGLVVVAGFGIYILRKKKVI